MKKRFYILFLFISITSYVFAENYPNRSSFKNEYKPKTEKETIDSLENELPKAKEDTNKVNLLNNIAYQKRNFASNECIKLGELAKTLSEKLHWLKGIANSLRMIGAGYITKGESDKALGCLEPSLKIYKEINYKSGISNSLSQIGKAKELKCEYSTALIYQEDAKKIAEEIGDKKLMVNILKNIAIVYASTSEMKKSLEYNEKALQIAEEIGDKSNIGRLLGNIGRLYLFMSNYTKSLEYLEKCLKISEEINDKSNIGIVLCHIGTVYYNLSNYPKALEAHEKAIKYDEVVGNNDEIQLNLSDIGDIYFDISDFTKAKENYEKALKFSEDADDKKAVADNLAKIGDFYSKLLNFPKALEYYERALKIANEIKNKDGICTKLGKIANIYCSLTKYPKALEYYEKALKIAGETGHITSKFVLQKDLGYLYLSMALDKIKPVSAEAKKENLRLALNNTLTALRGFLENKQVNFQRQCEEQLSDIYAAQGDYKSSLLSFKKAQILKDSIFSLENKKKMANIEIKKDLEFKDKELRLQAKENELLKQKNVSQNLELKTKNYQLFGALFGILSLFLIAFTIFRERKKSEDLLLNILPAKIAHRLKKKEHPIADHFDEASIVFIDMVDFTRKSADASAKRVVEVLNILYSKLDFLSKKHGLEKIKTIGDCYMAAAGIPETDPDNVIKAAKFSIEAMQLLKNYNTGDGTLLNFRCGMDCGPVVAGVIGDHKFIYDIWGDTVNSASRMEDSGEPGRIQVTERFKEKLKIKNDILSIIDPLNNVSSCITEAVISLYFFKPKSSINKSSI